MKVIIDLIENVRESIAHTEGYTLYAGLLKEDENDAARLVYAGEATINSFEINEQKRELLFSLGNHEAISLEGLISPLLILEMEKMMYTLKVDVSMQYQGLEVVGFGKSDEEKRYLLFIKV